MSRLRLSSTLVVVALTTACGSEDDTRVVGDIEVQTYPEQPMVVDLVFEQRGEAEAEVVDLDDAGVRSEVLAPEPDGRTRVRVRGLAPDQSHALELTLTDATGEERHELSVETEAPLLGFVPSFEVSTGADPGAVSSDYRLFDMSVLFANEPTGAFVVDQAGVTRWYSGDLPQSIGLSALWTGLELREDGSLLLTRDDAALIIDELGHEQLRIESSALGVWGFHHDIIELPNGNFIALSLSFRDIDYGPEGVLPVAGDLIVEFTPAGEVVWTWDSFDYLDTARRVEDFWGDFVYVHPETGVDHHDWTHGNGLVYEPSRDELLVSLRHQDWLLAIDHQTGEIRWALGPEGDFELDAGTWFWHQHSPQWQPDGSLLLYDNGIGNPNLAAGQHRSRAVIYALDTEAMVATQIWEEDSEPFLSTVAGDADRSSTGTLLVLDSLLPLDPNDAAAGAQMRIRELDPNASPMNVWTLDGPEGRFSYRAVPIDRLVGASHGSRSN